MNNRFFRALLLCIPAMLVAPGCDSDVAPDEYAELAAPPDDADLDLQEADANPCLTDDVKPGVLPTPPRGVLEPKYRVDEFEGMTPEELVPPPPTEFELQAALEYSDRYAREGGTLRTADSP